MGVRVSVLMPVYNAERYVGAAVRSILGQTLVDLELIVVDDGSMDGTAEVVSRIQDPRLRVIRLSPNRGYGTAVEIGRREAKGEFLARMDADDTCHRRRLEMQARFLDEHPEAVLVGTLRRLVSPNGMRIPVKLDWRAEDWHEESWESIHSGRRLFADPSVMVRTDAAERAGGWRNYQRSGMDVDLWLRILEGGGKAATLLQPLYFRRLVPCGIIFAQSTGETNQAVRKLADERRACGSDAVMRGDWQGSIVGDGLAGGGGSKGRVQMRLSIGAQCASRADFAGAWEFVKAAFRSGGIKTVGDRRLLAWCAGMTRGSARLLRVKGWTGKRRIRRCLKESWVRVQGRSKDF